MTPSQQQEERNGDEIDNNTAPETVTKPCHDPAARDTEDVVVFLSEKGIPIPGEPPVLLTKHVAEALAKEVWDVDWNYDRIYDQARRLPYRKHDPDRGDRAGLYLCSVRGAKMTEPIAFKPYGGPSGYDKQAKAQADREAYRKTQQENADRALAEHVAAASRRTQEDTAIAQAEAALTDPERQDLEDMAVAILPRAFLKSYERALKEGRAPARNIQEAIQTNRRALLLERAATKPDRSNPSDPSNHASNGKEPKPC